MLAVTTLVTAAAVAPAAGPTVDAAPIGGPITLPRGLVLSRGDLHLGGVAVQYHRPASIDAATVPSPPPPPGAVQVGSTFRPVSGSGPCLLLDGPGTISFGRGQFGGPPLTAAATTTVRMCDNDAPSTAVLASVRTGPGAAAWEPAVCPVSPTAPCPLAIDEFAYVLGATALTTTPTEIDIGRVLSHTLRLPPPGSTGAGSTVRVRVDFMGIQR
ncbi:MAG: hypothetical protein ACOYL9_05170 [Ilumatobacteraceae bacterium]